MGLCVCPQVLFEFFAVVTNPGRVTRPMEPSEAVIEVKKYLRAKHILKVFPSADIVGAVVELLEEHTIKGQAIFDLQLVATMLTNGISRIYTYNVEHFRRFPLLEVIVP